MTREEAIVYFESLLKRFEEMHETETSYWGKVHTETTIEAIRTALTALRPVSRERVEQIKGVWIFNDDWLEFRCSECHKGIGNIEKYKFCPRCGAPMTDEAVQMVMERL